MAQILSLSDTLEYQEKYAVKRLGGMRRPGAFIVASMLGGVFIGLADIFMIVAGGPLRVAGSPWAPLINGAVFGIGLILCVFAGGELATSAMMTYTIGAVRRKITWIQAICGVFAMLGGNFLGSALLAGIVYGSGTLQPDTDGGRMLQLMIDAKSHYSLTELFFKGVLCNILVCLAMWCVSRTSNEVTKIVVMSWCLAAFVAAGFEHVVANMTTFSLGIFHGVGGATLMSMMRNLAFVGLGNIVGGAVCVAAAFMISRATEDGAQEALSATFPSQP